MKQNEFFNEMDRIGRAWSMKHREHEKLKEEIIATKGWDSDELKSWYEEEKRMEFPFSAGASKAFRAWEYSEGDEVEMSDFCWEREVGDFVKTLCKAGLDSWSFTFGPASPAWAATRRPRICSRLRRSSAGARSWSRSWKA